MEELAVGVKAPESVREPDLHPRSVRPQNHWVPVHLDLGAHPASVGGLVTWASLVAQLIKESTCNVEDLGSIPELGGSPREGNGYPLQYFGLVNSMDSVGHGVTRSWT